MLSTYFVVSLTTNVEVPFDESPAGMRDFFRTMIEPYTKIYSCSLQGRLGQIIILGLFADRLGWNMAIRALNPRLG